MTYNANFPISADVLANPTNLTNRDDPGFELHGVISRIQDILEALEAKVGIGSSTPGASGAVLRRTGSGTSAWGGLVDADVAAVGTANIDVGKLLASGSANRVLATAASAPAAWQQVVTAMLAANAVSQIAFGTPTAGQVYGGAGASVAMTMSQPCSNVAGGGTTLIICTGVWQHTVAGTACFATIAQNGSGVTYETQATIPTASGYAAFAVIALTATSQGTTYTYVPYWRCGASSMALVAGAIMAVELKR